MPIAAQFFDTRSTRIRPVTLDLVDDELVVAGDGIDVRAKLATVKVDERLGNAARRVRFEDGTFCEVRDLAALDALLGAASHRDGWVDRHQRGFRPVLLATAACIAIAVAGYRWALPWAATLAAQHLPTPVVQAIGGETLELLDRGVFAPSRLPDDRRRSIERRFATLELAERGATRPALLFRRSTELGANAFTLPDGTIVVLDELVTSIGDERQVLAVLAHELGHADGRHSLRLLLQGSALGAFWAFYVGDISGLLAVAPAALMQARYSRDLEAQADDYGAEILIRNGLSPALLATALRALAAAHPGAGAPGYLASHPPTDERLRHLDRLATTYGDR